MIPIIPIVELTNGKQRKRQFTKGRQVQTQALKQVQDLLKEAHRDRALLIEHLHLIQDHYGQLSDAHLAALAQEMRLPQAEVYEVASFYHHFSIVKQAENEIGPIKLRICEGLSCEMADANQIAHDYLQTYAKLTHHTGRSIQLERVPCLGRCEQAPAAMLDQTALAPCSVSKIVELSSTPDQHPNLLAFQSITQYQEQGGYQHWINCIGGHQDRESLFQLLEDSGLRGLGGAGFPAGRKWRIVAQQAQPRLMAVNIDEGEPGTFKDRYYLERNPHQFLEGVLIAAWAVEIVDVYIYIRDEYHDARKLLLQEIAVLQQHFAGEVLPRFHVRRGAGAYICGEESAMIESIEGKRGLPRLRPPFVAQVGLFNRPTLEHNFETLYWIPSLIKQGAQWFSSHGRNGRKGLRSFSVSGRVNQPGVHCAPAGISLTELIQEYCGGMQEGHTLYAYLPGGASGGILPASLAHLPLDFDTLQNYGCFIGSAAIIVLSQQDSAKNAARNMMHFFKYESCGQCTPCRVGTAKAYDLIQQDTWDQDLLQDLSQVMRDASICGLGQAAPNPIDCVIRYFPEELK
jgi:formate dehydrogenase